MDSLPVKHRQAFNMDELKQYAIHDVNFEAPS